MNSELIYGEGFCRLCLNITNINDATDLKSNKLLCDVLAEIFPGMKIELVQTPRICKTCIEKLQVAFSFKDKIMCNELRLQTDKEVVAKAVSVCRLCLKQSDGNVVCLYENSNCSYSYELIRTMIEVVAMQLNFDIFKNPIMCNQCWSQVKDIYIFKKACFKTEGILRIFWETKGDTVLSDSQILSMIYKKRQLEDSWNATSSDNFGPDIEDFTNVMSCNVIKSQNEISTFSFNMTGFITVPNKPDSTGNTEFPIKQEVNSNFNDITKSTNIISEDSETSKHIPEDTARNTQTNEIDSNICVIKPEDIGLDKDIDDISNKIIPKGNVDICTNNSNFKNVETTYTILHKGIVPCDTHRTGIKTEKTEINEEYKDLSEVKAEDIEIYDHALSDIYDTTDIKSGGHTSQKSPNDDHLKQSKTTHAVATSGENKSVAAVTERKAKEHFFDIKGFPLSGNASSRKRTHSDVGNYVCYLCENKFKTKDDIRRHLLRVHVSQRRFSCNICEKRFKTKYVLNNHLVAHTKDPKFFCYLCEKGFRRKSYLCYHLMMHKRNKWQGKEKCICDICQKTLRSRDALKVHKDRVHCAEKRFVCDVCQKGFKLNSVLERHQVVHSEVRNFICNVCQKGFKRLSDLRGHKTTHSNERKYICKICQKTFKTISSLKQHVTIHSDKKRFHFHCDTCQKGFNKIYNLKMHNIIHSSEKKYVCEICQQAFKTLPNLKKHATVHTDERRFVCDICQKRLKTLDNLRQHRITHKPSERKYVCKICQKDFKTMGVLRKHFTVHSDERRFVCDICQKGFKTTDYLKRHTITHGSERKHVCKICQKAFKTTSILRTHVITHNEERSFVCDTCQRGFKTLSHLKAHTTTHSSERKYACKICQKAFRTMPDLKKHAAVHSDERRFVCDTCQKGFKTLDDLRQHKISHSSERKYICKICQQTFSRKSSLRNHFKTKTHIDNRRLTYDTCHRGYNHDKNLSHKQGTGYGRQFSCHNNVICYHCQKGFKRKPELVAHLVIHS